MYSFEPLADIPAKHLGFELTVALCVMILVIIALAEPKTFFLGLLVSCCVIGFAYGVSYHWTEQTPPRTFANVKVTGEFVKFEAEGYKERSGKYLVDRRFTYVVYNVNGNNVLMRAHEGIEYPNKAILYKN